MKKIVLLCAGGMSTSILVRNMKEAAQKSGYDCEIDAYAIDTVDTVAKDADCILLGPQVSYKLDDIRSRVSCPATDIDLPTYGLMDGAKALQLAQSIMGDN